MSAALVILPVIWATASEEVEARKPVARVALRGPSTAAQGNAEVQLLPQLAFYRKYTEGMLRRYVRLSMEAGRAPSLLGREMFRGKVTSYQVHGFDDVVIFVHDVENCLAKLDEKQQQMIRRIGLQEYTIHEAAAMTGLGVSTVVRRYGRALDRLTEIFLEVKLLELQKGGDFPCQGGRA